MLKWHENLCRNHFTLSDPEFFTELCFPCFIEANKSFVAGVLEIEAVPR